ncbi:MAG: DUF58 domain-containing protein [Dehalococcoidales bacterium]|nr:DUF58 domain-containing protein [Dehalococcoidales bacterium]
MSQLYNAQTLFQKKGKGVSSQAAGYLWSKFGLLFLLAILLFAAWNRQFVIVLLLGLIIVTAVVAKLWSRFSLVGVSYQRTLSADRAFPGESIDLKLRLVNRKLLPLPWVQVDDSIPANLVPADSPLPPAELPGCRLLSHSASLMWYTGINWRYRLDCRKRGCYSLGQTVVSSGDIFGFYPRAAVQPGKDEIVVYPRLYPVHQFGIPSLYPIGETSAARRIFEDPTRTIGVRDYTPHDSLRHVHWKASARRQNLQVKVFEPSTTLKVALFLAVDSFKNYRPGFEEDFELGVSAAASIASYAVQQRSSVGLLVNTALPDSGQPIKILPGGGNGQLITVLEALARVVPAAGTPFAEFFGKEWSSLPWGTTIILVVSEPPEALAAQLTAIKAAGYKALVLQIGENAPPALNTDSAWYHIRTPADLAAPADRRVAA